MLSFTRGAPIAVILGGELDKKTVRIADGGGSQESSNEEAEDVYEILADDDFKLTMEQYRQLPAKDREKLRQALGRLSKSIESRTRTKEIQIDDGVMVVLPSHETERVFIAGKSGSGKSTLAAMYMYEYQRMFPDRKTVLISRHKGEKAYQHIPHTAIPLELFEKPKEKDDTTPPVDLDDLKNSLVVFDDTDNLQDKYVDAAIRKLNDDIISNGRKYNIHCVTLAHQLMNWGKTRNLLLEANKVFFFGGGNVYHTQRFLKEYAGLDPKAIKKIVGLQSRWTMLATGVPQYVVHEHGAFVL